MIEKETIEQWQEKRLFISNLLNLYLKCWKIKILHQDHYAITTFLRGISCLAIKNKIWIQTTYSKIDPRIPIIYFSDSGSGKGMGGDEYIIFFGKTSLRTKALHDPTNEILVGSFNEKTHERNQNKGYDPSHEKYVDPVMHGFLERYDDVINDEGEDLFNAQEGKKKLKTFRMALDKYGSANNRLGSETLKNQTEYTYYCSCNIAILTYHIEGITGQILSNGIFQRNLCFFYHFTEDQIDDINLGNGLGSLDSYEKLLPSVQDGLKEVEDFIASIDNKIITVEPYAEKIVGEYLSQRLKYYRGRDADVSNHIKSFFPRQKALIFMMAGAFALSKKRAIIKEQDIREAIEIMGLSFDSLVRELVEFGVLAKQHKTWYNDMKRALAYRWRTKGQIDAIMAKLWAVSLTTAQQRRIKMAEVFEEKKGDKNASYLRMR